MSTRERRSLWGSISTSKKVNLLSINAALLYTWAIAQLDDEGFIDGDPRIIKSTIVPLRDEITLEKIPTLIAEIASVHEKTNSGGKPLWILHSYHNELYIQDPAFEERQTFDRIVRNISAIREKLGLARAWTPWIPLNESLRKAIYRRDNYRCLYCGEDLTGQHHKICIDHVIPVIQGGQTIMNNLATSCKVCNAKKWNRNPSQAGMAWPIGLGVDSTLDGGVDGGVYLKEKRIEGKEKGIELNRRIRNKLYVATEQGFSLAELLLKQIREWYSNFKPNFGKAEINRWGIDIDAIIRIDKKEPNEIKEVILFSQKDNFWRKNIMSSEKLRKQYDRLVAEMKSPRKGSPKKQDGIEKGNQKLKDAISGKSKGIEHKPR